MQIALIGQDIMKNLKRKKNNKNSPSHPHLPQEAPDTQGSSLGAIKAESVNFQVRHSNGRLQSLAKQTQSAEQRVVDPRSVPVRERAP